MRSKYRIARGNGCVHIDPSGKCRNAQITFYGTLCPFKSSKACKARITAEED